MFHFNMSGIFEYIKDVHNIICTAYNICRGAILHEKAAILYEKGGKASRPRARGVNLWEPQFAMCQHAAIYRRAVKAVVSAFRIQKKCHTEINGERVEI